MTLTKQFRRKVPDCLRVKEKAMSLLTCSRQCCWMSCMAWGAVVLGAVHVGDAAVIIDTFESFNVGESIVDSPNWTGDGTNATNFRAGTDPVTAGNKVLQSNAGSSAHVWSAAGVIGASETLPLSFRIMYRAGRSELLFGMLAGEPGAQNTSPAKMGPMMGVSQVNSTNGTLTVRQGNGTGGGTDFAVAVLSAGTWYTLTMVIDNAANNWTGTIQGGSFASASNLAYVNGGNTVTTFNFRQNTTGDLDKFLIRGNSSNTGSANPGTLFDDIRIVPEPGSLALMGFAGLLLITRRRWA